MADAQHSPSSNIIFKGTDGTECEDFVVAIRDLAFANGKEEDSHWMLHYATTRLRGKALRWHAKLDPSARKDWDLFVQALFEEFPLVTESTEDGIETPVWSSTTLSLTPPAIGSLSNLNFQNVAPSSQLTSEDLTHKIMTPHHSQLFETSALQLSSPLYDPSLPGLHVGRLRILPEGGTTPPLYVWWGPPHVEKCHANAPGYQYYESLDRKSVTTNVREALIVSFVAFPEPHQIGCLNSRQPSTENLGVQLNFSDFSEYHPIIGLSQPLKPRSITSNINARPIRNYQIVSTIWNVLNDGTLRATLADTFQDPRDFKTRLLSESYSTTIVNVGIVGGISFVKEYSVPVDPSSSFRPSVRARVVFEPV